MQHDSRDSCTEQKCVLTQADFDRFAGLSGDHNPIHVDADFAAKTRFGATVSHGMLLFTVLRGLIERRYPGAILTKQTLMFPAPAYANEELALVLQPLESAGCNELDLNTRVVKADGTVCLEGRCHLHLSGEKTA